MTNFLKNLSLVVCLLLVFTKPAEFCDLLLQALASVYQQASTAIAAPPPVAVALPPAAAAVPPLTQPGQGSLLTERVREALRLLSQSGVLERTSITLKQVQYVPSGIPRHRLVPDAGSAMRDGQGYYVVTLSYDILQPLNSASGDALLRAVCASGAGQVRLLYGSAVKPFHCAANL